MVHDPLSDSPPSPAPAHSGAQGLPLGEVPRKPGCGCWKIFLVVAGIFVVFLVILGISVGSAVHWIKNAPQPTPVQFPPTDLTAAEKAQLQGIDFRYHQSYYTKKDLDVTFTPKLFNAFVEREIQKKQDDGTAKPDDPVAMQLEFDGPQIVLRGSAPAKEKEGTYVNFEARGELRIEDGQATAQIDSLKLAGQEAPWLAMSVVRWVLASALKEQQARKDDPETNPFAPIKLLERKGDEVHLIVDGSRIPPPEDEEKNSEPSLWEPGK